MGVALGVENPRPLCPIARMHWAPRRQMVLIGLAFAATLGAQPPVSSPTRDAGTPLATAIDSELPDGDEVWENARQALAAAADEPTALRALVTVVNLQRRRGDYAAGLDGARDGLARARQLGDLPMQVDFLYLLGRLYWNLTDYPRSLEHHLEELRLATRLGDPALLARTHGGLGLTYQRFGRNDEALQHFARGLEFAAQARDDRIRSSLLNSLGNYHLGAGNLDQAATFHEQALRLREGYGNRRALAESLTNLGLIADARGDSATALAYLGRALATFETLKYRRYLANTHRRLAQVLRRAGRTDEALTHLQTALQLSATLASAEVQVDLYQELALTHEARGDFAAALAYQRRQATATERMRGEQDRQRMDELQARYGAEQRELEIALLKRGQELQHVELRRRRSQNLTLAAGLVGGVALLGAIIMLQRSRLRAERRLHAATEHARERAATADRLKSRLLQIASHDLKVPLTALNATAERIGRQPDDPVAVRQLAAGIQADTARMRRLVHDFLDTAAVEDSNLQLHAAEHDLGEVARAAVASLGPVAAAKEQALTFIPAAHPLPRVNADGARLRQVFDNLVGNALKFTPVGGAISVTLGETAGWVHAEIQDNGPGLGPAEFARIFSPHPPAAGAGGAGADGDSTGLGLFIVRELLTLQGGRLEVQSQPGRGAVFRVLLPPARPLAPG